MKLSQIIKGCGVAAMQGPDREIAALCSDSRQVVPGALFVAVKGYASDGHAYIASAIEKGAVAIAYEDADAVAAAMKKSGADASVTFVQVENSRHAVALMADNFFDHPSRKLTLVGITGTNGKTTTVTLLYHLFMNLGYSCGLLSTIANFVDKKEFEAVNTTSDPITINSLMAQMVQAGCEYCFMEVSSIGVEHTIRPLRNTSAARNCSSTISRPMPSP